MKYKKKKRKILKAKESMLGHGNYLYENNTDADLSLPKPSKDGQTLIGPRQRFYGDSYFLTLVKPPYILLRLIEEVVETIPNEKNNNNIEIKESEVNENKNFDKKVKKKPKKRINNNKSSKKGIKMKEKLILDQPDVITQVGKVENVLNSEENIENLEEKLLTENPMGDIEIISE